MNTTGFHDSALCCVGAVKNSCIFILYLGELSVITLNNALQPLFSCGIWLLSSLPWLRFSSRPGDFAVNTIGKDEVLPRANAVIVSIHHKL